MLVPSSPPLSPHGLQPASRRRRSRSMSVCVPPSSYSFSHALPPMAVLPKRPSTPPPDLSSSSSYTSPCMPLAAERDTFAGRLSKALETVLPLHSASSLPGARQRRASLPALFSTPVGSQCKTPRPTMLVTPREKREREEDERWCSHWCLEVELLEHVGRVQCQSLCPGICKNKCVSETACITHADLCHSFEQPAER